MIDADAAEAFVRHVHVHLHAVMPGIPWTIEFNRLLDGEMAGAYELVITRCCGWPRRMIVIREALAETPEQVCELGNETARRFATAIRKMN